MKFQIMNYEIIILIYHICRYIMLPYRKSEICFKYLRIISRMKAAYIFLFSIYISRNQYHKSVLHNSRFTDFKYVLPVSVVDHESHSIQL